MFDKKRLRNDSIGFTLLELLIVMAIMGILAALVLNRAQPAMQARRLREGARMFSAMLITARSKAMVSKRPYGVWIERFGLKRKKGPRPYSTDVFFARVQSPYSGDTLDATAEIQGPGSFKIHKDSVHTMRRLVNTGDLIRFDYQGPLFRITGWKGRDGLTFEKTLENNNENVSFPGEGVPGNPKIPFQIFRRPVRSTGSQLRLPLSVVIDLAESGIENGTSLNVKFAEQNQSSSGKKVTSPIFIMFSPDGTIGRIYYQEDPKDSLQSFIPSGPIYFLIGRNDQVADVKLDSDGKKNIQDLMNYWVVIQPNGLVSVASISSNEQDPRSIARKQNTSEGF